MHFLAVLAFIAATSPGAQQPAPADSARSESTPTAVTPTPDQKHFLDGLRTASRGIATTARLRRLRVGGWPAPKLRR